MGDIVGINAKTDGVLVLANEEENIEYIDKLREGDNILYIEDTKINSSQDVYDILNKLKNSELLAVTPSHAVFKYEALLQKPEYKQFVFDDIARVWGNMLYNGATTFWETDTGAAAFGNAGSLCHAWSATPAYLYMKYRVDNLK